MDQPRYRIDRFDPLLRDLLWWGLVRPEEPADGSDPAGGTDAPPGRWVLSEEAAQRLTELAPKVAQPQTGDVLYLDRRCADCHQRVPTRLVEGLYLCDTCRMQRGPAAAEPAPAAATTTRQRRPAPQQPTSRLH